MYVFSFFSDSPEVIATGGCETLRQVHSAYEQTYKPTMSSSASCMLGVKLISPHNMMAFVVWFVLSFQGHDPFVW